MARITCHPLNKDIVFVSGGANIGLWRSWLSENASDAVPTFTQFTTAGPNQSLINEDWGCPMFDTGRVVVTRTGGSGFHYSDNLGKDSWVSVDTVFTPSRLMDFERAGLTGGMAFASGSGAAASEPVLIRTINYGTTWQTIISNAALAGLPVGFDQLRALAYDANTDVLYISSETMSDVDCVFAIDNATTFQQGISPAPRLVDAAGLNVFFDDEIAVGGLALQ